MFYRFDTGVFDYYVNKFSLNVNKPIRNFSKGMKRQLFISVALACRPEYLFLDEAFDGLDPLGGWNSSADLLRRRKKAAQLLSLRTR